MRTYRVYPQEGVTSWALHRLAERCKEARYVIDAKPTLDGVLVTTLLPLTPDEIKFIREGVSFDIRIEEE